MATITGLTADRMLAIEDASIVDGEIVGSNLILTKHDGTTIDAGPVIGPPGPQGPTGPAGVASIPGEIKLWPGGVLPVQGTYGKWVWADGGIYPVATYPIAAGHIAAGWRTFAGASDPGGTNFRVPDLRGLVPAGMDGMPGGARANRMTRAVAITLAGRTGEETHVITVPELAAHSHGITDPGHQHVTHRNRGSGPNNAFGDGMTYKSDVDMEGPASMMRATPTGITIQSNGNGTGHENVQPTVFVPYIVRLDG